MAWRVAASLLALRDQANGAWPNRSRLSDGTVGDPSHQSRNSDHNPWVREGSMGVVTALDVTHDRASGCDAGKIAEAIRVSKDRRVKYIIWNRRIANSSAVGGAVAWAWRPYTGANPHDKHVHISVKATKALYDSNQPWEIDAVSVISDPVGPDVSSRPLLRRGSRAAAVSELQALLNRHGSGLAVDGKFGEVTETAVKGFQRKAGLVDDGAVGAKTWAALLA
jgi:hypothetical protein